MQHTDKHRQAKKSNIQLKKCRTNLFALSGIILDDKIKQNKWDTP